MNVRRVERGRANDFCGGIDGQSGEGKAGWCSKCSEVAVPKHVPGADRAIEGRSEEDVATFRVLGGGHCRVVFGKGSNMEPRIQVPYLDEAIVRTSYDLIRIW